MLPVAPAILSSRVSCLVRDFLIGGGLGFPLAIRPTAPRAAPLIAPHAIEPLERADPLAKR